MTFFLQRIHSTHFNLNEALEAVELLKPKRTILTGMTHEVNAADSQRVNLPSASSGP